MGSSVYFYFYCRSTVLGGCCFPAPQRWFALLLLLLLLLSSLFGRRSSCYLLLESRNLIDLQVCLDAVRANPRGRGTQKTGVNDATVPLPEHVRLLLVRRTTRAINRGNIYIYFLQRRLFVLQKVKIFCFSVPARKSFVPDHVLNRNGQKWRWGLVPLVVDE